MELTFLGTSSMVPTKERNVSAIFLSYNAEGILFDCGEGTQRQMNICGINRNKVSKILLSHWHADHAAGIIGLLQTISNAEEKPKRVDVFGPKGTVKRFQLIEEAFVHDSGLNLFVHDVDPKNVERFYENEEFALEATKLDHTTACLGYSFVEKDRRRIDMNVLRKMGVKEGPHLQKLQKGEDIIYQGKKVEVEKVTHIVKGRKISYVADTKFCHNAILLAKDADLLISEASYADALQDKATEYKHMTAADAARVANESNTKKLILTHFSQRYKTTAEIEEDARTAFNNVVCAKDFMRVVV